MIDGKRAKAYSIVKETFHTLSLKGNSLFLFTHAIDNIQPLLEVRKIRKSGRTLLIPKIVSSKRGKKLAMRWLLEEAKKNRATKVRSGTLAQCLAAEILNAYQKTGSVIKKRDDLHKLAEANRSFSHFRWW
nr:ribosomal protein S7 [Coleochaete scutata]